MKRLLALGALFVSGCFAPGSISDEMPDDLPAGSCRDTDTDACETSSSTSDDGDDGAPDTTAAPDACSNTEACFGSSVCVAAWDDEADARGPFECRFACVPLLDEAAWCSDDASCCDPQATCSSRGYCVVGAPE